MKTSKPDRYLGVKKGVTAIAFGGLAVVAGACQSATYGTGKASHVQLLEDATGIFTLGLEKEPEIDYSKRPDLVLPPESIAETLPEPQSRDARQLVSNWPDDLDVHEVELRALADKNEGEGGTLTVEEGRRQAAASRELLDKQGRKPRARTDDDIQKYVADRGYRLSLQELREQRPKKRAAAPKTDENGQRKRRALVEPPASVFTPSKEYPLEVASKKEQGTSLKCKVFRWLDSCKN